MKNEQPLVTVVTPCFNHEKFIEESLDSVRNQTYSNIQHIIIDDCSKDNSTIVIEKYILKYNYKCIFIKNEKNIGVCSVLNKAIALSEGKYWSGCTSDDTIMPYKIENLVDILESAPPEVGVVFSDAYLMDDNSFVKDELFIQKHRNFAKIPEGNLFNVLLEGNFIPGMALLLKTSIFNDIGVYDENLNYEDYDMWLRIASKYQFIYHNKPMANYRIHDNNFHTRVNYEKAGFFIYIKHINMNNKQLNNKIKSSLRYLYLSKHKNIKHCLKKINSKIEIPTLLEKSIQLNLPVFIYKILLFMQKKYRDVLKFI
tara:strand:- start:539 stop:1477 length:939 start_codon:yes stop_codon:yes gene_type:complete